MAVFQPGVFQSGVFQTGGAGSPTITADAIIRRGTSGSVAADAVVRVAGLGSATVDAVVRSGGSGSVTADAVVRGSGSGAVTLDAFIRSGTGSVVTADAIIRASVAGSLGAEAVVRASQSASVTADAVLRGPASGSFAVDAITRRGRVGSVNAAAVVRAARSGSVTADAIRRRAQLGSFTADAVVPHWMRADAIVKREMGSSFTASAWIYSPRADPSGHGAPGETPLISIMVDGVDITRHVLIGDATFTMQVNGTPGQFKFRVKDTGHQFTFISGAEVTVDIDGKRKFGGYLSAPKRGFAFPVQNTADPDAVTRYLTLEGVDYNILFRKRVVRDKADPSDVGLRSWPKGSRDDVVIKYVFDNYTDLGADGATYNGVTHVGSPNPDKQGVVASGGLYFGDAMTEINRLINGLFYFDQYKDLHFVDVDTVNAPVAMSDNPGPGEIGYRDFTQVDDGTKLANDALIWGAGMGPKDLMVFSRSQDAASIAAHKRWQYGEFTTQLFRQASVDERAESVVYGTAQNKRGGKDDQQSWRAVTFDWRFSVGQKVTIESEVFGIADVVPIRRLTITFPQRYPQLELTMGHEIDLPWNQFEYWYPKLRLPDMTVDVPDLVLPPPPGDCVDIAGITDTFTRTTAIYAGSYYTGNNWGVADAGLQWRGSAWYVWVDGSSGVIGIHPSPLGGDPAWNQQQYVNLSALETFDGVFDGVLNRSLASGTGDGEYFEVWCGLFSVRVLGTGQIELTDFSSTVSASTPVTLTSPWKMRLSRSTGNFEVRIWAASGSEPVSPTLSMAHTGTYNFYGYYVGTDMASIASGLELRVDNLDIEGVNRVSEFRFDNFDRIVSGSDGGSSPSYGWGYPSNGTSYWYTDGSSANVSVDGTHGVVQSSTQYEYLSAVYQGTSGSDADVPFRDSFEMRADFVISQSLPASKFIEGNFIVRENVGSVLHGLVSWYFSRVTGDPPALIVQDAGGTASVEISNYVAGEVIHVAWSLTVNGEHKAKIWFGSDVEPDWMVSRTASGATPGAWCRFTVGQDQNWSPTTVKFDYINFSYDGKPCYSDDGTPVFPESGTPGRAVLVGDGATKIFELGFAYHPGTTEVFKGGYFQRPGYEYTELSPAAGTIEFTNAPAEAVQIDVFYKQNGPVMA